MQSHLKSIFTGMREMGEKLDKDFIETLTMDSFLELDNYKEFDGYFKDYLNEKNDSEKQ